MSSLRQIHTLAIEQGRPFAFFWWAWGRLHKVRAALYALVIVFVALGVVGSYFRYLHSVAQFRLVGGVLDDSQRGGSSNSPMGN